MIQFSHDISQDQRLALESALHQDSADTVIVESFAPRSQYDELLEMSPLPPHRVILLAFDGLGFHGQYQRPWQCGKGNIYLCAKLETAQTISPQAWPDLLNIAPRAILRAVAPSVHAPCTIKPINDVMIDGKKTAGALTHCRQERTRFCIFFGIGLNVRFAPACDQPTTCVANHCPPGTDLDALFYRILHDLLVHLTNEFQNFVSNQK